MAISRERADRLAWIAALGLALYARRVQAVPWQRSTPMTLDEIRDLARDVGFAGMSADVAAAVAYAESAGDPFAQGDPHGVSIAEPNGTSTSFGLWQVHLPAHPEYDARKLLQDVHYAARAAFDISKGGTNWTPWTTFVNGSYRRFMPRSPASPASRT